ncbi:DNA-binding transcriptional regulator FabR [Vibrio sp. UCD-FRSSP16_10]|uniref:HTH-type transcriptional repressor FabR n=1 Tax=unclassified Vibrio TaxID=2614977 RepID=UPI0007FBF65B|nr:MULTISPECIES: HTH-type transcriptional repressor FabR [unclassified Vibrio]OBT12956.1 DNA-binding transcriptional regulator FabR [Vibrio sp. UCD-FRSSP16_30]OBT19201.1 DNA-binding transcriptional regulator FabR [Vibrio sp. UCD-FRSSP16_10]
MGVRAEQKLKTRRAIIDAALGQLSAGRSFSSMSLREVAREAGIAPTSFYRHFDDMEQLGLVMVDEAGLLLRQLMRRARERIQVNRSVIQTSIETFVEFIETNPDVFRLLLREGSGTSEEFRSAVAREKQFFSAELADYLSTQKLPREVATLQADAIVTLVFSSGAEFMDVEQSQRFAHRQRLIEQVRMISLGGHAMTQFKQSKT